MSSFGFDPSIFTFKPENELRFVWEANGEELSRALVVDYDCSSSKETSKCSPYSVDMTIVLDRPTLDADIPIFAEAEELYFPQVRFTIESELDSGDEVVGDSAMEEGDATQSDTTSPTDFSMEVSSDDVEGVDNSSCNVEGLKLAPSKSPIMDALVYCALNNWGIRLLKQEGDDIQFEVTNFKMYYKISSKICAKQNPTEDQGSRIKALKRWFPDFPSRRERGLLPSPFTITVSKGCRKDNKPKKLHEIIDRNRHVMKVTSFKRSAGSKS